MRALDLVGAAALSIVLLTWFGYPLVAHTLARLTRRASVPRSEFCPGITVILATRDEASLVDQKVACILRADYPPHSLEVVVAFDTASYQTIPLLPEAADPRVQLVLGDVPGGKAATLNAAVRRARGDVLVFTDTRQTLAPDSIGNLVQQLADPSVGAVSGVLVLDAERETSPIARYWSLEVSLRLAEARWHSTVGVSGSLYAMRRADWEPLPAGLILDDLYTPMRLALEGKRIVCSQSALVRETRQTTPHLEYQRKVRTLAGNIQLCLWLPNVLRPGRNPIFLQFLCHKLLRLATPVLVLVTGTWLLVRAWGVLVGEVQATASVLIAAGVIMAVTVAPPLRIIKDAVVWGAYMLSAAGIGVALGVRRRWDVWT
jgi:cellulose synthase/poly-beta-1,6-N-acetylglucosamine synthase-like glycosyltransferase